MKCAKTNQMKPFVQHHAGTSVTFLQSHASFKKKKRYVLSAASSKARSDLSSPHCPQELHNAITGDMYQEVLVVVSIFLSKNCSSAFDRKDFFTGFPLLGLHCTSSVSLRYSCEHLLVSQQCDLILALLV